MVIQVPTSSDKLIGPRQRRDTDRLSFTSADLGLGDGGTHLNPITPSVSQWEGSLRGAVVVVTSPSQLASSSLQRMHCTAPCMHACARVNLIWLRHPRNGPRALPKSFCGCDVLMRFDGEDLLSSMHFWSICNSNDFFLLIRVVSSIGFECKVVTTGLF